MINLWSIYFPFAKGTLKSDYLAYKSRFMLWAIANGVSFMAQLFLWKAIYSNSKESMIGGYSFSELITYLGFARIAECVSYSSLESSVANGIKDGRIVNSFIKPISFRMELLFRSIGQVAGSLCLFIPVYMMIFFVFSKMNGITIGHVSLGNFFLGTIFLLLAFFLNYFISLLSSCIIFKTIKYMGIYQVKKTLIGLLSGAFFPITFYPVFIKKVMRYLPFVYLRYYPCSVLQGTTDRSEMMTGLCIAVLWIFILYFISSYFWKKAKNELVIFGG